MTTPITDLIARLREWHRRFGSDGRLADVSKLIRKSITHLERIALLEAAVRDEEQKLALAQLDLWCAEPSADADHVPKALLALCADIIRCLSLQNSAAREALEREMTNAFQAGATDKAWRDGGPAAFIKKRLAVLSQNPGQQT